MTERIRFDSVSKEYPSRQRRETVSALSGIDLSMRSGEIFTLIGPSGAGKSTLLRMINGLEKPTSGSVLVDGIEVQKLPKGELRTLRHRIGMVFQQFNLWNSRTVYGNIAAPLKIAGWKEDRIAPRVAELLDFVGLGDKAFAHPKQLSGGQKQRVGIARAIAGRPDILLADEVTSALDPQTTKEVVQLLKSVNREFGITIVAVTHEMDVVAHLADRVAILSKGELVEIGELERVFSRPDHPITGSLVGSYARTALTAEEQGAIRMESDARFISIRVESAVVDSPVISRIARAHSVDFTFVQGGVAHVKGQPYGQISLALYGEDAAVDAFLEDLTGYAEIAEW
ncbi:methionine ABC transporter ATP-binding protein [Gulosibacter sp. 10]|uniref:methionine ABC transporter ATP-binding protein n=1 Tax=Gulosibacter sp. 10 TaxID=1255570 RepID=UPI00097F6B64|nr:methionine ABC transporter ATP-binding protein [Gulosibacter sp. 10]SJM55965.1 Methionine ABC transporter ATP-binding protein [Gulosibacter sp. 10]